MRTDMEKDAVAPNSIVSTLLTWMIITKLIVTILLPALTILTKSFQSTRPAEISQSNRQQLIVKSFVNPDINSACAQGFVKIPKLG